VTLKSNFLFMQQLGNVAIVRYFSRLASFVILSSLNVIAYNKGNNIYFMTNVFDRL